MSDTLCRMPWKSLCRRLPTDLVYFIVFGIVYVLQIERTFWNIDFRFCTMCFYGKSVELKFSTHLLHYKLDSLYIYEKTKMVNEIYIEINNTTDDYYVKLQLFSYPFIFPLHTSAVWEQPNTISYPFSENTIDKFKTHRYMYTCHKKING